MLVNSNPTLDRDWNCTILLHGSYHHTSSRSLFHQDCTKLSFSTNAVTGTIHVQIDFVISVFFDYLDSLSCIVGRIAANLANYGRSLWIIPQVVLNLLRVDNGFVHHHFGPQDALFGHDSKEMTKLAVGNVQHGSNVERLAAFSAISHGMAQLNIVHRASFYVVAIRDLAWAHS
jgi:hypothetical protein